MTDFIKFVNSLHRSILAPPSGGVLPARMFGPTRLRLSEVREAAAAGSARGAGKRRAARGRAGGPTWAREELLIANLSGRI